MTQKNLNYDSEKAKVHNILYRVGTIPGELSLIVDYLSGNF